MSKRTADEESAGQLRLSSLRSASKRRAIESSSPPYSSERSVQSAPQQRSIQSSLSDEVVDKEEEEANNEEDEEAIDEEDDEAVDEEDDPLLYRVLTRVEYTRAQHAQGRPVMQTT